MIIDDVHRGITKHKRPKRIGRGPGSGHGKTSGRGHKGQGSRRGYKSRLAFSGGQIPIFRVVAKRGFNNSVFATDVFALNLSLLEDHFESGETVSPETLKEKGLVKKNYEVLKILAGGEITKKLVVKAHRMSKAAEEKLRAAGGSFEKIS